MSAGDPRGVMGTLLGGGPLGIWGNPFQPNSSSPPHSISTSGTGGFAGWPTPLTPVPVVDDVRRQVESLLRQQVSDILAYTQEYVVNEQIHGRVVNPDEMLKMLGEAHKKTVIELCKLLNVGGFRKNLHKPDPHKVDEIDL